VITNEQIMSGLQKLTVIDPTNVLENSKHPLYAIAKGTRYEAIVTTYLKQKKLKSV